MTDRELDLRGLECPLPVVRTKKALDEMGGGALRVLVSKEVQSCNVADAARAAGLAAEVEDLGDCYRVTICAGDAPPARDAQGAAASQAATADAHASPAAGRGTTFFLGADAVGRGNDDLGRLLARLMLQTLSEAETPPARVVLMNTGVRLACEGSPAIEALRALEARGTTVLACGTCLDFLGLLDQVRVGKVSNMYDILEALAEAERVVAP
jgi:selenium metabolism protein YedF